MSINRSGKVEGYRETIKRILRRTLVFIFLGIIVLFFLDMPKGAWGLLFGGCVGCLNFGLLAMDTLSIFDLNKKGAFRYAMSRSLLRYLIYGVSLVLAYKFWGKETFLFASIGLLLIKIAIFTIYG